MEIRPIQELVRKDAYRWRQHAIQRSIERSNGALRKKRLLKFFLLERSSKNTRTINMAPVV